MKKATLKLIDVCLKTVANLGRVKISTYLFKYFSIVLFLSFALDSVSNSQSINFKVAARGSLTYYVDVPPNAKSFSATVMGQSQHVNMDIYQPNNTYESCSSTTWSDGIDKPINCNFNNPKPGKWTVIITGSVHIGSVAEYPFVTGKLIFNSSKGTLGVTGEGVTNTTNESLPNSSFEDAFKVKSDGFKDYYFTIPPNVDYVYVKISEQTDHVIVICWEADRESEACRNSTWSYSNKTDPVECSVAQPNPGQLKVRVKGSVHVSQIDKIPFVLGKLSIKLVGKDGKELEQTTGESEHETPPGHPEVEIPDESTGVQSAVPEAGTWYPSATMLEYDSHLKGYINKGDYDMYKFYFPGGILNAHSKGNLDLVADLLNSKEERVARDITSGEGNNFKITGNYPAGLYYIQIRVMHHGGEGPYELCLGNGNDWSFVEEK